MSRWNRTGKQYVGGSGAFLGVKGRESRSALDEALNRYSNLVLETHPGRIRSLLQKIGLDPSWTCAWTGLSPVGLMALSFKSPHLLIESATVHS